MFAAPEVDALVELTRQCGAQKEHVKPRINEVVILYIYIYICVQVYRLLRRSRSRDDNIIILLYARGSSDKLLPTLGEPDAIYPVGGRAARIVRSS